MEIYVALIFFLVCPSVSVSLYCSYVFPEYQNPKTCLEYDLTYLSHFGPYNYTPPFGIYTYYLKVEPYTLWRSTDKLVFLNTSPCIVLLKPIQSRTFILYMPWGWEGLRDYYLMLLDAFLGLWLYINWYARCVRQQAACHCLRIQLKNWRVLWTRETGERFCCKE